MRTNATNLECKLKSCVPVFELPKTARTVVRFGDLQSTPKNYTRVFLNDPVVNEYHVTPMQEYLYDIPNVKDAGQMHIAPDLGNTTFTFWGRYFGTLLKNAWEVCSGPVVNWRKINAVAGKEEEQPMPMYNVKGQLYGLGWDRPDTVLPSAVFVPPVVDLSTNVLGAALTNGVGAAAAGGAAGAGGFGGLFALSEQNDQVATIDALDRRMLDGKSPHTRPLYKSMNGKYGVGPFKMSLILTHTDFDNDPDNAPHITIGDFRENCTVSVMEEFYVHCKVNEEQLL